MSSYFPTVTITFDAALRDLASVKEKSRAQAAHALRYLTDADERARAVEALLPLIDDISELVRSEAAASLGELGNELAVSALARAIDDPSPLVRQAATLALGHLGFESTIEPLTAALHHNEPDVRFQAATALVELGVETAVPLLIAATRDDDAQVASAAALGLGSLGDQRAVEPLAALLEHHDTQARFDAAYALTELGDPRGFELLARRLDDDDLAWDAIDALESIGDERAVEPLAALMTRKLAPPHLQLRAAGAVLTLSPGHEHAPRAKAALLEGLKLRKVDHRGVAAEQLARVGGTWAIEPLRAAKTRLDSDVLDLDGAIAAIRARSVGTE